VKPFLKWAGGKYRLVERISALLPPGKRLIEPFVGSGALFLNTNFNAYLLADANGDLINLYTRLRDGGDDFVEACALLFTPEANSRKVFDARRSAFNATCDGWERARLFVYLNKHCYNGLCRYNSKGAFNVPFGRYAKVAFPEAEMRAFQAKALAAEFVCADFGEVMRRAQPGDVVYCDPPYVPLSNTAHFTSYSATPFDLSAQERLAAVARLLAIRDIPVLISNHNTELTRALYAGAKIEQFSVRRSISCNAATRGVTGELLALFTGGGQAAD
jgi:DNA adenine methylase